MPRIGVARRGLPEQDVREIVVKRRPLGRFEVLAVDDGSRDGTDRVLMECAARFPELVLLRHRRNAGQSASLLTGVQHARADWVATLDGDGQNDPADIPRLLAARAGLPDTVRLLAGHRVARRDSAAKRVASTFANAVRRRVLGDQSPDTGCGTKLFAREAYLALPRFAHMHRFLPALFRRDGWEVATVAVNHRARSAGRSKYGNLQRLAVGMVDLLGVCWLLRRHLRREVDVVASAQDAPLLHDVAA